MSHADHETAAPGGERAHDPFDKAIKVLPHSGRDFLRKDESVSQRKFYLFFLWVAGSCIVLIMCQVVFRSFCEY